MRFLFVILVLFIFTPLDYAFSMDLSTLSVEMERLKKPIAYTYKISGNKSLSRGLQITEFKQTKNSVLIKIKSHRPSVIHLESESCVERGFLLCKSFGSYLYKLKLTQKSVPLKSVTNFKIKRSFIKKIDNRIMRTKSKIKRLQLEGKKFTGSQSRLKNELYEKKVYTNGRLYVDDKRDNTKYLDFKDLDTNRLTLNFNYIGPKIKTFSLLEGGYGSDNFYDITLPSQANEDVSHEKQLLKLTKLHDEPIDNIRHADIENLINLYGEYPKVRNYFESLLLKKFSKTDNAVNSLVNFISLKHTSPLSKQRAIKLVYSTVDKQNNIAAYNWFIGKYPEAQEARKALQNLYNIAFSTAKSINTIEAYNDFIIAYPYAKQIPEAKRKAYKLEAESYSGWFSNDEKNSRALLVRSKQLARKMRDAKSSERDGYRLVIDRMNQLLQDKYPAEDATLRHLESEEFKDFYRDLKKSLDSINSTLERIERNTSDLRDTLKIQSQMVDLHFRKAAQSKEMANKYTKQHRHWERYLKDQGI